MKPFSAQTKQVPFPKAPAPSLEGLTIKVPGPKPVVEADIILRLIELQRQHSTAVERTTGEKIGPADEVCVNTVAYCLGKLVPHSARFDMWVRMDEATNLPELGKAIALANVGDSLKVQVSLPADFVVPEFRGKQAIYIVDITAAQQLKLTPADDPGFLAKLGVKTVAEALVRIGEDVVAQRKLKMSFDALELALDAAAQRITVNISPALLDQELWNQWAESEGKALTDHGIIGTEQSESFESWKNDPAIVADVKRRIRNSVLVGAIAESRAKDLTTERLLQTAQRWTPFLGIPQEKVQEALDAGTAEKEQIGIVLLQIAASELVLEQASVTYV